MKGGTDILGEPIVLKANFDSLQLDCFLSFKSYYLVPLMTLCNSQSRIRLTIPIVACLLLTSLNLILSDSASSVAAAVLQDTPLYSAPVETAPESPTANSQQEADEPATSQSLDKLAYDIQIEKSCPVNPIQSQGTTGTCWCFATASFIEAEMLRENKGTHHFSEMFIAKNIYRAKANNYLLRHGKAQFSEGALAHDFLNAIEQHGLVPEAIYDGLFEGQKKHNHSEMASALTGMLEALSKRKTLTDRWAPAVDGVLDAYLGSSPERFEYNGRSYSPLELSKELGFKRDNYVSLTSFTHHPFGESFVLEIPDNFSNGKFLNLPIDDLVKTIDNAIANGYTVAWDGDVSEAGFSSSKGMAILPEKPKRKDLFKHIGEEKTVTQADRQKTFMSYSTTDDHLMHLVGISRDAAGNKYYIIKNSWGEIGPFKGYLHMSEAYVRAKTIALIVNKEAVVNSTKEKQ